MAVRMGSPSWRGERAAPLQAREVVHFDADVVPGTGGIRAKEGRLYLVLEEGLEIRYPVAVGKPGKQWDGWTQISGKYVEPAWSPPEEVRQDNPSLPSVTPADSPANPMGPRAMTLAGDEYAIHGTNRPESIGKFAS